MRIRQRRFLPGHAFYTTGPMATDETREYAIEPHSLIGLSGSIDQTAWVSCSKLNKSKDHIPTVKLKAKEVAQLNLFIDTWATHQSVAFQDI